MVNTKTVREHRAFRVTRQSRSTCLLYTIEEQANVCGARLGIDENLTDAAKEIIFVLL